MPCSCKHASNLTAFSRYVSCQGGGAKFNDEKITDIKLVIGSADLASDIKLSMGKKKHGLITLAK